MLRCSLFSNGLDSGQEVLVDNIFIAAILGIVEGLTEFLPISSTGHLILAAQWLAFTGEKAETFEIFIQLGAILAVVVLYRQRFKDFIFPKQHTAFTGIAGIKKVLAACLPVLLLGFFARDFIKATFFNTSSVAWALIVGGIVMLVVERLPKRTQIEQLEQLTLTKCLCIGLFQCFSLWSGISRSGSTIVGGLLLGVQRRAAAEFSFLVAVPVMCAATIYELLKSIHILNADDLEVFAMGFLVSFLSALLAIRVFVGVLQRFTLAPFGLYRICLGLLVLYVL